MNTFVFVGPTISRADAQSRLDATYLPPVSQGDVIALLRQKPDVIGIIDGYFDRVPAVWHKEILLALSLGVTVVGAASMGALRAAELHPFGMVGVGEIFEWYRDGVIDADDEVAVHHAPADYGYQPFNEAMVNIRKTLQSACRQGIITPSTLEQLIHIGQQLPYWDRSYARILRRGLANGLAEKDAERLGTFLETSAIDLKRRDAIQLLCYINELPAKPPTTDPDFQLHETVFLRRLMDRDQTLCDLDGRRFTTQDLVDHVRLATHEFPALKERAATNALILDFARHLGLAISDEEWQQELVCLQRDLDLPTDDDVETWCRHNQLSWDEFHRLVAEFALIRKLKTVYAATTSNQTLLRQLRRENRYAEAVGEGADKRAVLAGSPPAPSPDALVAWYFTRQGLAVPGDVHAFAAELGFHDYTSFMLALEEHYQYHQHKSAAERKKEA